MFAPLFVSYVVYDGVCTCDLCQLVPFQLEQDKNSPRLFPPEKFELSGSEFEFTGRTEVAAWPLCRVGGIPLHPAPDPCLFPLSLVSFC